MKLCPETGKRCYDTERSARKNIGRRLGTRLRAYLCPFCHYFHLTKGTVGRLRPQRREDPEDA